MVDNSSEKWHPFENGETIGKPGPECGTIIWDEEYSDGARLTITGSGHIAPFSINIGVYDWIYYNLFFNTMPEARDAFQRIKPDIENILALTTKEMPDAAKKQAVDAAIKDFIRRYPSSR